MAVDVQQARREWEEARKPEVSEIGMLPKYMELSRWAAKFGEHLLDAAEERDAYLSALARGMKMNDAARDECEGLRSAADALVRIVKILMATEEATP